MKQENEIKPINLKGNQAWILIERTDSEAETSILPPLDVKSWIIREDLNVGKDEMVGWHHPLNGHEFQQTPGDSERQESLLCYSPWGHKELDTT